jgi:hypothetical protein
MVWVAWSVLILGYRLDYHRIGVQFPVRISLCHYVQPAAFGMERQHLSMYSVMLRKPKELKLLAKNMQHNGQPLKHHVLCRAHCALDSGIRELRKTAILFQ